MLFPQRRSPAGGNHEPPKIGILKRKKASSAARFLAKSITQSNPLLPAPQRDPRSSRTTVLVVRELRSLTDAVEKGLVIVVEL